MADVEETPKPTKTKSKTGRNIAVAAAVILVGGYMLTQYRGHSTSDSQGEAAGSGSPAAPADQPLRPGEAIPMNGLSLVVQPAQLRTQVGFDIAPETAADGGVLVLIRYAVTNNSDKPISAIEMPQIKLVDGKGTSYSADAGKTGAYAIANKLDMKILSDLNPGITVKNAQVFEVSKASFDPAVWMAVANGQKVALK